MTVPGLGRSVLSSGGLATDIAVTILRTEAGGGPETRPRRLSSEVSPPGFGFAIFTAEPGSASHDVLSLLASRAATEMLEHADSEPLHTEV
jgi:hypothetical protein